MRFRRGRRSLRSRQLGRFNRRNRTGLRRRRARIQRHVSTPLHYVALFGASTTVTTGAPIMAPIFPLIAPGMLPGERLSNRIMLTKIEMRFACNSNAAGAGRLRLMMIRDKQTSGAAPPSTVDWFLDKTGADSWYSLYDPSTVPQRYEILMDKSVSLNVLGGATDQGQKKSVTWRHTKKHKCYFINTVGTGVLANIEAGSIVFAAYSENAATGPNVAYEVKFTYRDGF